ncbi:Glycosyl hydrolases family 25 [Bacteroidales bacterium KHT7]|uniref:glycoside hydrolase family 25 protein n=1 Tax=unclassified Bacteroides TaxID=2646097 RepID=UPI00068A4A52|nr:MULTISPECIES: GH25 family lysozyme [unclassified Bacteroides]MBQ3875490.1 glycosyl hydrolase family 25 [Bacteroidaceae bacterium]SDF24089.1 Glycosyl hydrolases family 25 [Bacteroidales bacterium KHT7]
MFKTNKYVILTIISTLCLSAFASNDGLKKDRVIKKSKTTYRHERGLDQTEPDPMPKETSCERFQRQVDEAFLGRDWEERYRCGIDVSHYQGKINWDDLVEDKRVGFVYLKATEGATLVDNTYDFNFTEAKRVGLKVGSYHFYSTTIPISQQIENFSAALKQYDQDLVPIVDVEVRGKKSHDTFCAELDSFLVMVTKACGTKPMIYTSSNFYNKYMAGRFDDYKLFIARYHLEAPTLIDDRQYVLWQYTSKGRVKGIAGAVDMNRIPDEFTFNELLFCSDL